MPKVFIPHRPNEEFSYAKAEQFGELVVMFTGRVPLGAADDHANEATIKAVFLDLGFHEGDFLLLSGTKLLNAMAIAVACSMVREINVLCYVAAKDEYIVHKIKGYGG